MVSTRSKSRVRLGIRYFDDRILLTETHAWAYYRVPSVSYEFTTPEEREALATNITVALAAIRMQDAEVHLRIAHRSYPAVEWATGLDATSDGGPGWREYLEEIYQHVWAKDFWAKEIYLGVRLGQRGMSRAAVRRRAIAGSSAPTGWPSEAAGIEDDAVSAGEIAKWTEQAERLGRALTSGALAARHATSREVAWLFRHTLMGSLNDPLPSAARRRTWGAGEIEQLFEGQIQNGRTLLRLEPSGGRVVRGIRFLRPVPRRHVVPRGGAVAALRGLAAVPGRGQLPDEAHLPGQGQQGRRRAAWRTPATWTRTSGRPARRRRSRWRSRSPRPGCLSMASPRSGCRSSTAGTG